MQPDFDSLIDLITSTIKPTSWDEVGGPGSIMPFPTGVWVDPGGTLRSLTPQEAGDLAALRDAGRPRAGQQNARRGSPLRMVSLPRLEKCVQLRLAAGEQPTEEMQVLAGLNRVRYVFIYPDSGDIVLAGPAGDWRDGPEGAIVSTDSGRPVLRLDDLVVVFRQMMGGAGRDVRLPDHAAGREPGPASSIPATDAGPCDLSRIPPCVARPTAAKGGQAGHRGLRARSAHAGGAGHRRSRLPHETGRHGPGSGRPGVESYLKMVKVGPGHPPPAMTVFRWWFTLKYDAVQCSPDRLAFTLRGQGVKVLSENEFLTAQGQQLHTGVSEGLNRKFARDFTEHFEQLCRKYPIYGELRNIFELALVGALLREEAAGQKVGWHFTCFGDPQAYPVELSEAPKEVESVVNCRVIGGRTIIAGVSGGVRVSPESIVCRQSIGVSQDSRQQAQRQTAAVRNHKLAADRWWWD